MKEGSTQPYWFLEKACPDGSELCLGLDPARVCGGVWVWVWVCMEGGCGGVCAGLRLPGSASSPSSKPVTCSSPPSALPAQATCRKPPSSHDPSPHLHSLSSLSAPDTLPSLGYSVSACRGLLPLAKSSSSSQGRLALALSVSAHLPTATSSASLRTLENWNSDPLLPCQLPSWTQGLSRA